MKIKNITIRNFRSIKEETLIFPDNGLLALIGSNNAGKSNFLRALDLILGEYWNAKGEKLEDFDYYCGDRNREVSIIINFDNGRSVTFSSNKAWPEYMQNSYSKMPIGSNVKNDFPCTYLSAERSVTRDIAFTKWSLMGKVSKSFNSKFKQSGKEDQLKEHFEKVKEIFDSMNDFKSFQDDFKMYFNEMQSDSPYKLNIDFKPFTPNNYFKTINILASDPSIAGCDFDIEELGDGAKNIIILSLLRSYAKNFRDANGLLAIEEPEIYLHPQARRHLFQTLKSISEDSQGKIQIIYTTHDSAFLELSNFESIRRVFKVNDEDGELRKHSKIKSVTADNLIKFGEHTGAPYGNTKDKLLEFYRSISNYRLNEAFFSRLVILTEGATEELSIPVYLEKIGINCDSLGISVLGVGGKGEIPKYWRLFYSFDIPVIAIFDNDSSDQQKKKNNKTIADCFNCTEADIEAEEDVFIHKRLSKDGIFKDQDVIILQTDFETSLKNDLRAANIDISQLENEGKELVAPGGKPKQVLARWIAMKLKEQEPTYTPSFILKLKELIEEKLKSTIVQSTTLRAATSAIEEIPF